MTRRSAAAVLATLPPSVAARNAHLAPVTAAARPVARTAPQRSTAGHVAGVALPVGAVVVGLDPGIAALGWGVVRREGTRSVHVAHGCVTTPVGDDHARVTELAVSLRLLLALHKPVVVAVERWVCYGQSATTQAHTIGLVLGMIATVCAEWGVPMAAQHRAQDWRTALGLRATATKAQAQERVRVVLGMTATPRPQHAADALAVAMTTKGAGR